MNPLIETANHLGEQFLPFAWPMFWQSSLLIAVLFGLDFALRRRLRAAVRYALWLIVVVKLLLPPTLALPTGIAWWANRPAPAKSESRKTAIITYDQTMPAETPLVMPVHVSVSPPPPMLSPAGWFTVVSGVTMLLLLAWLMVSWRQIARTIRTAAVSSAEMDATLLDVKRSLNLRQKIRLRLTSDAMSPAVCGLIRPTILMPKLLAERLSPEQLRAVLLHELIHLRRGDVWVNCAQTLVQIAYWWHPLLWLANARIRRVREEAVDDAVMLALRDGAEAYAPTLLEVAKVAISRPLAGLRMVGILESRGALRQRIERLINFRPPRHAGLTLVSVFGILAFTALAVPMGAGPARLAEQPSASLIGTNSWPDPHFSGYEDIDLLPRFLIVDEARLRATLPGLTPGRPVGIPLDRLVNLQRKLNEAGAVAYNGAQPQGFRVISGGHFHVKIGGCTNGITNYNLEQRGTTTYVLGADYQSPATQPGWSQMDLFWTPWKEQGTIRSEMKLALDGNTNVTQDVEITIPVNGALVWMVKSVSSPGKCQIVLLQPYPADKTASITPLTGETQSPDALGTNQLSTNLDYANVTPVVAEAEKKDESLRLQAFKIKPDVFIASLRKQAGLFVTDSVARETVALLKLLADAGVEIQPPKSLFLNPKGAVLVRATSNDLAAVAAVVDKLNYSLPQVNLKGRFIELPAGLAQPFVREFSSGTNRIDADSFSAILTSTQAKEFLTRCDSITGANITVLPDVTTLSGRQAEVRVVDVMTVVKGIKPEAFAPPGITNQNFYLTEHLEMGPTINLIPRVMADEYTIQMSVVPKWEEFLGYDGPTNSVPVYEKGKKKAVATIPIPRPHFRSREMAVSATLMDGQSLLLGGVPCIESITSTNGIVESKTVPGPARKQLFVLVTPILIDPAGNRFHEERELNMPSANLKSP